MAASVQILPRAGLLDIADLTGDRGRVPLEAFSLTNLVSDIAAVADDDPQLASFRLPSFLRQSSLDASDYGQNTGSGKREEKQDDLNPTCVAAAPVSTVREIAQPVVALPSPVEVSLKPIETTQDVQGFVRVTVKDQATTASRAPEPVIQLRDPRGSGAISPNRDSNGAGIESLLIAATVSQARKESTPSRLIVEPVPTADKPSDPLPQGAQDTVATSSKEAKTLPLRSLGAILTDIPNDSPRTATSKQGAMNAPVQTVEKPTETAPFAWTTVLRQTVASDSSPSTGHEQSETAASVRVAPKSREVPPSTPALTLPQTVAPDSRLAPASAIAVPVTPTTVLPQISIPDSSQASVSDKPSVIAVPVRTGDKTVDAPVSMLAPIAQQTTPEPNSSDKPITVPIRLVNETEEPPVPQSPVGRTPRSAADASSASSATEEPARGPSADQGARPTILRNAGVVVQNTVDDSPRPSTTQPSVTETPAAMSAPVVRPTTIDDSPRPNTSQQTVTVEKPAEIAPSTSATSVTAQPAVEAPRSSVVQDQREPTPVQTAPEPRETPARRPSQQRQPTNTAAQQQKQDGPNLSRVVDAPAPVLVKTSETLPAVTVVPIRQEPTDDSSQNIETRPRNRSEERPARGVNAPIRTVQEAPDPLPVALPNRLPHADAPVISNEIILPARAIVRDSIATAAPPNGDIPARPVMVEQETGPAPVAQHGELAFAARLSSPGVDTSTPDATSADLGKPVPNPRVSIEIVQRPAATSSQVAVESSTPTEKRATSTLIERFVKPEVPVPPAAPAVPSQPATRSVAPAPNPTPAARMDHVIEPPEAPVNSGRDITVRVPDATERGTDVRFVERGGEVRVSVRTADADLAQTLRGGLGDFVNRLEHGGIQAEVWSPGSDASSSQNNSQQQSMDQDSSGRSHSGSREHEDDRQEANRPRWVEELETSIGKQNSQAAQ